MKLNLNTILLILGGLAVMAPDFLDASAWLTSLGVHWLLPVAHGLAVVALACGGLALALPRLRKMLALLGLATPPGALAPWNPASGPQPAIIPLMDGSAVVQVRPPTDAGPPSLVSVALDPSQVASNRGSVVPSSQLDVTAIHGVPAANADDAITGTIRPPKGVYIKPTTPNNPTKT